MILTSDWSTQGASFLLETQDISSSLFFWRKSIELRTTTMGVTQMGLFKKREILDKTFIYQMAI